MSFFNKKNNTLSILGCLKQVSFPLSNLTPCRYNKSNQSLVTIFESQPPYLPSQNFFSSNINAIFFLPLLHNVRIRDISSFYFLPFGNIGAPYKFALTVIWHSTVYQMESLSLSGFLLVYSTSKLSNQQEALNAVSSWPPRETNRYTEVESKIVLSQLTPEKQLRAWERHCLRTSRLLSYVCPPLAAWYLIYTTSFIINTKKNLRSIFDRRMLCDFVGGVGVGWGTLYRILSVTILAYETTSLLSRRDCLFNRHFLMVGYIKMCLVSETQFFGIHLHRAKWRDNGLSWRCRFHSLSKPI